MKILHFADTEALYSEFCPARTVDSRDMDENTLAEYEAEGNPCAMTLEHARERADIPHFSFEQMVV